MISKQMKFSCCCFGFFFSLAWEHDSTSQFNFSKGKISNSTPKKSSLKTETNEIILTTFAQNFSQTKHVFISELQSYLKCYCKRTNNLF